MNQIVHFLKYLIIVQLRILLIIGMLTVAVEVRAQKPLVPVINQQEQHLFHSTTNEKSYNLAV